MLDGLRALAIGLVLWQHSALPGLGRSGTVGVTLFFVLSGFLITRLLAEERATTGRISLRAFYWRRGLRLFPALALLLAAMAVLGVNVIPTLLYAADFAMAAGQDLGPLDHTWSLAVEEQFYLVWPVLLIILLRLPRRHALTLVAALALASAVARILLWPEGLRASWAPDTRADALLVGALLGLIQLPRIRPVLLALASVALAIPTLVDDHGFMMQFGLPLATLGSAVLVAAAAGSERSPWRPILTLGIISYGVYLWSGPFLSWGRDIGPEAAVLTIPATIIVAALSYHFVERPFLRLKQHSPLRRAVDVANQPPLVEVGRG